ncbi:MAG TPA: choice-of-anchor tandem repeat GloVer-containing protein [Rhizomicrobium sp.]|jgi:uncharacterized repeat protein (TIGR03803 family)|nr:choice-of-anchor tandem repeat GloVer-containing protein [Rhizomicrobium sp.]
MLHRFDRARPYFLAGGLAAALLLPINGVAAKGYHVVYTFQNSQDGDEPHAGLIKGGKGIYYGTTFSGGSGGFNGNGTVFKLARDGSKTELYSFTGGTDGNYPNPIVMDGSGNLFGTAQQGGVNEGCNGGGCGVVFEVTPDGVESVLYTFTGEADGGNPVGGLLGDGKGGFYGTAAGGGADREGTVFHISAKGAESLVHAFAGGSDGASPEAELVSDTSGNMYSTTKYGGTGCAGPGCGTIFKVTPGGKETVLYAFTGGADGANPISGLIADKSGNLYGTAEFGGQSAGCGGAGCGTVFKLAANGKMSVLYTFSGGNDGGQPVVSLIADEAGNLYGTTLFWGAEGYGVVFRLAPNGKEKVLHSFTNGDDGAYPWGALLETGKNKFLSTASGGGATDFGTVFAVK